MRRRIIWKVVKRKTRYSAVVYGNSKFGIKYEKGEEVKALPETLGIMAFRTKSSAEWFLDKHKFWSVDGIGDWEIVRLQPTSRVKALPFLCNLFHSGSITQTLNNYYNMPEELKDRFHKNPPYGTVVCHSAIVLD